MSLKSLLRSTTMYGNAYLEDAVTTLGVCLPDVAVDLVITELPPPFHGNEWNRRRGCSDRHLPPTFYRLALGQGQATATIHKILSFLDSRLFVLCYTAVLSFCVMKGLLIMQSALKTACLEGFTKKTIDTYLVLPPIRKSERADLVTRIALTLAQGTDCTLFSTQDFGPCEPQDYLIHGLGRYLVRGRGETVESFQEQDERLSFFLKAGFVSPVSLPLPTPPTPQEDALRRDADYRYTLASHPVFLTKTTLETVELAIRTQTLQIETDIFWPFVFATEDVRAEISVAHAAALLGLSTLTLHRRIGEGKLPAVRASSLHPGIKREGLEEYIGYRQTFPQGCGQIARYQSWRATWREQYQQKGGDGHEGGA